MTSFKKAYRYSLTWCVFSCKTEIRLTFTHVLFFVTGPHRQFDFKVCVATSCIIGGKVEGSWLLYEFNGTGPGADCMNNFLACICYWNLSRAFVMSRAFVKSLALLLTFYASNSLFVPALDVRGDIGCFRFVETFSVDNSSVCLDSSHVFSIWYLHLSQTARGRVSSWLNVSLKTASKMTSNVSLSLFIYELKTTRTTKISRGVHCWKPNLLTHFLHESAGS